MRESMPLFAPWGSFAAVPWNDWTWLGPGHTIAWPDYKPGKATLKRNESLMLPGFRNDPIHILWIENG